MNKFEEKVLDKYRSKIFKIIKNKYKNKAKEEAKLKKIYFSSKDDYRKKLSEITKIIMDSYIPIISEEVEAKVDNFKKTKQFQKAIESEKKIEKLSYKSLKKYQEFPIKIPQNFIDKTYSIVNKPNLPEITKEEIVYITLLIFYKIIEYISKDFIIKIGTTLKIYIDKRDLRINFPNVKKRIVQNRLIPKIKLCSTISAEIFKSINKNNMPLMNYFQAKMERLLLLLKSKQKEK